jgi:hypothetical protein
MPKKENSRKRSEGSVVVGLGCMEICKSKIYYGMGEEC